MKKFLKNFMLVFLILFILVMCILILYFANLYCDEYKTNLFSAIFCVVSLISATSLGIIAIWQNYVYNKRQKQEKDNQLINLKRVIASIIGENDLIIKSWEISKKKVFNLCENTHYKMTNLKNFEFNIFKAINLEPDFFAIINDYNNTVSVINFNINNYNKAISGKLIKDIEDFRNLLIKNIKSLQKIVKRYKQFFGVN